MGIKYYVTKLGRKANPEVKDLPRIFNGSIFTIPASAYVYDSKKNGPIFKDKFIPEIDKPVLFSTGRFGDTLRISHIQDFYIHGDFENSSDKIRMKYEDAHVLKGIEFKDGDMLLTTLNSFYFLKAVKE